MFLKILLVILNFLFLVELTKTEFLFDFEDKNGNQSSSEESSIEKYLKAKIQKPWVKKLTGMAEEIGEMKYRLKLCSHLKMMLTTLVTIENMEEKYTQNLTIILPSEMVNIFEKRIEERKQRFLYILKKLTNERFIRNLITRIQENGMSTDEFSLRIAEAHHYLSQTIQDMILSPGTLRYYNTPEYKKARDVLRILMNGFKNQKKIFRV